MMTDRYERIREALADMDAAAEARNALAWQDAHARFAAHVAPATIRALLAERDALARDAARYRWLRDGASMITDLNPWEDVGFVCAVFVCTEYGSQTALTGEDLDAAIDSAMQRTSGGAA